MAEQAELDVGASEPETVHCDCGHDVEESEVNTYGNSTYCQECFDDNFSFCPRCEEIVPNDDFVSVGGESVCEYCRDRDYSRCGHCREWVLDSEMIALYCESCYDEHYFTCDSCGNVCHNDDYGDDGNCRECCGDGVILSHDKRIDMGPIGKGPHYFGVELEVEVNGDCTESAQSTLEKLSDFAICKEDGSLGNGYEIVTRPASLEEQIRNWDRFFDSLPGNLRSFQTETCGLHIHTSRKPLSQLTIGRMLVFVNEPSHRQFIERIAGRSSGQWARIHQKKLTDGSGNQEDRYEAVNLLNHATVEFRIFKGTLKRESVYKAIEFVAALIRFCSPCANNLKDWQTSYNGKLVSRFCDFVKSERKEFPHLWGFISAKWLGAESVESKRYGYEVRES